MVFPFVQLLVFREIKDAPREEHRHPPGPHLTPGEGQPVQLDTRGRYDHRGLCPRVRSGETFIRIQYPPDGIEYLPISIRIHVNIKLPQNSSFSSG